MTIHQCRAEIDEIDAELLKLMNRRVELAMTVGELKRDGGLPLYDPRREEEIIRRAQHTNSGPLDEPAVIKLFRRIIHITRRIEAHHVEARLAPVQSSEVA